MIQNIAVKSSASVTPLVLVVLHLVLITSLNGQDDDGKKKTPPPPPPDFSDQPVPLEKGHLDLRFVYSDGDWDVFLAYEGIGSFLPEEQDEAVDEFVPLLPGDGVLVLEDKEFPHGSRTTRPSGEQWEFLGVSEEERFWFVPQSFWNCLWPGFAVSGPFAEYQESDDRVLQAIDAWVSFRLRDVRYVGAAEKPVFSTWTSSSVSGLKVWMATLDEIDETDRFLVGRGGHAHLAWGFSDRGVYEVDLEATAFLGPGATSEVSTGAQTFTFAVGSFAQWQAHHFSNGEIVNPSVSGPEADPDGDRVSNLFEYAFRLDPREPGNQTFSEDGRSGLPKIRFRGGDGSPSRECVIEYPRRRTDLDYAPAPQIRYLVEMSSDLGDWIEVTHGTEETTPINNAWEHVKMVVDLEGINSTQGYVRMRVELLP